jgi:hypothetical protein
MRLYLDCSASQRSRSVKTLDSNAGEQTVRRSIPVFGCQLQGVVLALLVGWSNCFGQIHSQREDFPQFHAPGLEREMYLAQELFHQHHGAAFSDCTLWDAWLPHGSLWPAIGPDFRADAKRSQYRNSLMARRVDGEGYVSMQQHRGMAHSEGWPFPAWQQSTGVGWHFSTVDEVWAIQNFALQPLTNTDGWEFDGGVVKAVDTTQGLSIEGTSETLIITTPLFRCGTIVAPFLRMEWIAKGLPADAVASVSWQMEGESDWHSDRAARIEIPKDQSRFQFSNIPLYRQRDYNGLLRRYRIEVSKALASRIQIKSILTAIDTRHPITNANWIRGSVEYFQWTGDLDFLKGEIAKLREAMEYALREFQVHERKMVYVPWVGHDGRSGLVVDASGKKQVRIGLGVGNNYWDLLPFGGLDALATIYHLDAIRKLSDLESAVELHPEWQIPLARDSMRSTDLMQLGDEIQRVASQFFWNPETGRFIGWEDTEGKRYDYGFTFLNTEAIYYGLATEDQAKQIYQWLDGQREVEGDTSRGKDIYHWRFGPRSTTKRNIETYMWAWTGPESIPWGGQVQDGGAVLGFSYFDMMSRIQTRGPEDAWHRFREIIQWYAEVQEEGGYRAYYAKPGRGTLQGGGPAGGLGMDQEFMESVLVPQAMLYGFLGCKPLANGLVVQPKLPEQLPEFQISRIQYRDHVLHITARPSEIEIEFQVAGKEPLRLLPGIGDWTIQQQSDGESAWSSNIRMEKIASASGAVALDASEARRFLLKRSQ